MLLTHGDCCCPVPNSPTPTRPRLARYAPRNYRQAIDQLTQDAGLAA